MARVPQQPSRDHRRLRLLHGYHTEVPNSLLLLRHRTRPAKSSALQGTSHHQLDCPATPPYRYVLFDRDAKFGSEVHAFLESSGVTPKRTTVRSPWQNGTAERWVGSVRRELLDHVIPLNETHLRRLGREYIAYYHEDRTHIALQKDTPAGRAIGTRPTPSSRILPQPRIGGLHHRYTWTEAA